MGDIIHILLEKADVVGYLTMDDLMQIYPEGGEDSERLNTVINALRRRGVELVDDDLADDEGDLFNGADYDPYVDMTAISTSDTVGLYMKEMARVPLLSVDEEIFWPSALKVVKKPSKN
jgi:RNA polymerase primary sigma factor